MEVNVFENKVNRVGTDSSKWDGFEERFPGLDSKGCIPMWVADTDFFVPEEVRLAVLKKAEFGIYGYPKPVGNEFKSTVKNWISKRHDWITNEESIVAVGGVVPAINYAIQAFTKEEDGVIIQPPVYYPFKRSIVNNNRKVVENNLLFDGDNYNINFKDFEEKAKNPKNKLFILCNPHNPIGKVWGADVLNQLAKICLENNVIIFSDEIHSDIIFNGFKHIPLASLNKDFENITITAYSASKTFNLAGLKTSALIIPNERLKNSYCVQLSKNAAEGINIFGPTALIAAYTYGEKYLSEMLLYLEDNINLADKFIKENLSGVKLLKPEGTYLVWINFRESKILSLDVNRFMIEKAKVAVDLGNWFGDESEGFIRLNFACHRSTLIMALNQIKKAFDEYERID